MSIESTLSFHMGTRFNEKHNNRTIPCPMADSDYEKQHNWYHPNNMSLEQAYEILFAESFNEYNSSIRKDRRYNSYLEKLQIAQQKEQEKIAELRHSGASAFEIRKHKKAVKSAYELIIGLGNARENPEFCKNGEMQDTAKDILLEYVEQFERENKNVFLYNAAVHTGENGCIHLHADVIFWADCSRGQRRQASLTKALAQMGYTSDKEKDADGKRLNAITKWEMKQREILRDLCKASDIEIIAGKHSQEHLETKQFQAKADSEFVSEQAEILLAHQDEFIEIVANSDSAIAYLEHLENEELRQVAAEYEAVKQKSDKAIADAWEEFNSATSAYFDQYRENKKLLFEELQRARRGAKDSRKQLNGILNEIAYSNDLLVIKLLKLIFAMFMAIDTALMEREVQRLQEKNQQIKAEAKRVMSESRTVSDALRQKDADRIEAVLTAYEETLFDSIREVNNYHYKSIDKAAHETVL